jgi:hypothetical protein
MNGTATVPTTHIVVAHVGWALKSAIWSSVPLGRPPYS